MIYLANPSTQPVRNAMAAGLIGAVMSPAQGNLLPSSALFAIDNGCGPGRDGKPGGGYPGDEHYVSLLQHLGQGDGYDDCDPDSSWCLFAVAPDVVGNAAATLRRSERMLAWIRYAGFPAALAAQDGLEHLTVPWGEFDVLFIGGSTAWKLGPAARRLVAEAKRHGKHVHMGRVNSLRRLRYARAIGCDSADGTYLAFGPRENLPRLLGWLRDIHYQGTLFGADAA
jgi:hypothetical protein